MSSALLVPPSSSIHISQYSTWVDPLVGEDHYISSLSLMLPTPAKEWPGQTRLEVSSLPHLATHRTTRIAPQKYFSLW